MSWDGCVVHMRFFPILDKTSGLMLLESCLWLWPLPDASEARNEFARPESPRCSLWIKRKLAYRIISRRCWSCGSQRSLASPLCLRSSPAKAVTLSLIASHLWRERRGALCLFLVFPAVGYWQGLWISCSVNIGAEMWKTVKRELKTELWQFKSRGNEGN